MMDIFTIKQWLFLLIASIWMLIFFDVLIALLLGCIFFRQKRDNEILKRDNVDLAKLIQKQG